ncbi:hypothetical protein QOT17_020868 [Balamuthia mandrillaris]
MAGLLFAPFNTLINLSERSGYASPCWQALLVVGVYSVTRLGNCSGSPARVVELAAGDFCKSEVEDLVLQLLSQELIQELPVWNWAWFRCMPITREVKTPLEFFLEFGAVAQDFSALESTSPPTEDLTIPFAEIHEVWTRCEIPWLKRSRTFASVRDTLQHTTPSSSTWEDWITKNVLPGKSMYEMNPDVQRMIDLVIRSLVYQWIPGSPNPMSPDNFDCSKIFSGVVGCVQFLSAFLQHLASSPVTQKALRSVLKRNPISPQIDVPAEYQYHFEMYHFGRALLQNSPEIMLIPEYTVQTQCKRVDLWWMNGTKIGFELAVAQSEQGFLSHLADTQKRAKALYDTVHYYIHITTSPIEKWPEVYQPGFVSRYDHVNTILIWHNDCFTKAMIRYLNGTSVVDVPCHFRNEISTTNLVSMLNTNPNNFSVTLKQGDKICYEVTEIEGNVPFSLFLNFN